MEGRGHVSSTIGLHGDLRVTKLWDGLEAVAFEELQCCWNQLLLHLRTPEDVYVEEGGVMEVVENISPERKLFLSRDSNRETYMKYKNCHQVVCCMLKMAS